MSTWAERLDGPVWARLRDAQTAGAVGILLGISACLVALPPVTARSPLYPVLFGIPAASARRPIERPSRPSTVASRAACSSTRARERSPGARRRGAEGSLIVLTF